MINKAHLIASEAVVEEEVSESVVEVGTKSDEAVRLVRVGQLPEEILMVVMRMTLMVVIIAMSDDDDIDDGDDDSCLKSTSASSMALASIMDCW